MKQRSGKVLNHLGMEFDYTVAEERSIDMSIYVTKMVKDFSEYELQVKVFLLITS